MESIAEIFAAQGLLARGVQGFSHRSQQQEMAEAVAEALEDRQVLISEAGTGTGKTFAYLIPALLSGRKVIISTGTRNLQDQLFHRDLPLVRKTLAVPVSVALLKGRSNYLCRHRMDNAEWDPRGRSSRMSDLLSRVRAWSGRTSSGDIAELVEIPEDAPVWPLVTSTTDNCLGQECPSFSRCHLVEARRAAQEADLVVVNHHLLCADMALRDEGFGELLPGADCFVLDEAHQLPEVASNFFGTSLSGRQLIELGRDTVNEYHKESGDVPQLLDLADRLPKLARDLRLAFGVEPRRAAWSELAGTQGIEAAIERVQAHLVALRQVLEAVRGRGKGLDSCLSRCTDALERLGLFSGEAQEDVVRWFETQSQGFRLNCTPLEIAGPFQAQMQRHSAAWIFTSATLAVGDSFRHFADRLGIADAHCRRWESPFDYRHQALLFVPPNMPDPRDPDYTAAVSRLSAELVAASRGRAFLLFTSHRALQQAARQLESTVDYPLLVQGSAPRAELLERFRELGNAVLLGTSSFWEGVDVRGSALSCVVIDKLPFASPGDPVLQARIDGIRRQGGNPFMSFQVPQAVIALKQGAGRLIRDVTDRGVLAVCDPRLLSKPYGRVFLDSLPPMSRTRELQTVQRFFAPDAADRSRQTG